MSEAVETTETPETPNPAPKPQAPEQKSDELPEWARKQISDANQEAAQRRVALREAQEANRTLQEQLAELTSEKADFESRSSAVQADFDKLVTAVQTLLPEKHTQVFTFAKTLQGSTEEELANHAAELNQMFGISASPSPAVDRSQGLGAGAPASDPASQFAAFLTSTLNKG